MGHCLRAVFRSIFSTTSGMILLEGAYFVRFSASEIAK